jgi:hypothetical protein
LQAQLEAPALEIRAWWNERPARELTVDELENFEDLYIRNTDAMLEYGTLGTFAASFPRTSIERKLDRMEQTDSRPDAHTHYSLYRAEALLKAGRAQEANQLLASLKWREIDRLAQAQALAVQIKAQQSSFTWLSRPDEKQKRELAELKERLFSLLPSHLRYAGAPLPVKLPDYSSQPVAKEIASRLTHRRFEPSSSASRYTLSVNLAADGDKSGPVTISLYDEQAAQVIASVNGYVKDGDSSQLVNSFIHKAFSHRGDPPAAPLPKLDFLEGILDD